MSRTSKRTRTAKTIGARRKWLRLRDAVRRAVRAGHTLDRRGRDRARRGGASLARHWERTARSLLSLGGVSTGNRVTIHYDGDDRLDDMWQAIAKARRFVWLETYIIEPDRVGLRTIEELTRAAERGCRVILLYDSIGSAKLPQSVLQPLRDAGGAVRAFNPFWTWRRRLPLLRRDHRKILIVDGDVGFTGGMNVSEDYAGKRYGNSGFQDCHLRLEGPGVRDLARVLASSWQGAAHERLPLPPRGPEAGPTYVQALSSAGMQGRRAIQRSIRVTVRNAVRRCRITTPYFVPPQRLLRAMIHASKRGADVRLMTAGKCDVPIVRLAAQHIYGRLLKEGIRIWEYDACALHAKTIAIDGVYCTVGSFNLDQWSHKRNLEVNVGMLDPEVTKIIEDRFEKDVQCSTEVTLETLAHRRWWQKLIHWAAYELLRA